MIALCVILPTLVRAESPTKPLDGWREFRFGMSPEQAKAVATIPVEGITLPLPQMEFHEDLHYRSKVIIGEVIFDVSVNFADIAHHKYKFEGITIDSQSQQVLAKERQLPAQYRLNRITLEQDFNSHVGCPLQKILMGISSQYGAQPTLVQKAEGPLPYLSTYALRFSPTRLIEVISKQDYTTKQIGSTYETVPGDCRVIIIYRDESILQPILIAPPAPKGQF